MVGVLLLGDQVGRELAERLKNTTRSEVTFLTGRVITASTLEHPGERDSILEALRQSDPRISTEGMISEIRGSDHVYVTLMRRLPESESEPFQFYALQRSLDVETAFLRSMQSRLVELGALAAFMALLAGLLISERITSGITATQSALAIRSAGMPCWGPVIFANTALALFSRAAVSSAALAGTPAQRVKKTQN